MTRDTRAALTGIIIPRAIRAQVIRTARRQNLTAEQFVERSLLREMAFRRLAPKQASPSSS